MDILKIKNEDGTWSVIPAIIGPKGDPGPRGETGPKGDAGIGVPAGGSEGQVLAKSSALDYETEWVDPVSYTSGTNISITNNTISTVGLIPDTLSSEDTAPTENNTITWVYK